MIFPNHRSQEQFISTKFCYLSIEEAINLKEFCIAIELNGIPNIDLPQYWLTLNVCYIQIQIQKKMDGLLYCLSTYGSRSYPRAW